METTPRDCLEQGMPVLLRRLERRALARLAAGFARWDRRRAAYVAADEQGSTAYRVLLYLQTEIDEHLEAIYFLRGARVEFEARYVHAVDDADRRMHVLDFARAIGRSRRQLRGDARALRRWFGRDAVLDRCARRLGALEQELKFVLERAGELLAAQLRSQTDARAQVEFFHQLQPDHKLEPLLSYDGDVRVQNAAFTALARGLAELPAAERETLVKANVLQHIYRAALDTRRDVWLQCAALALLQHLAAESFVAAVCERFTAPGAGDDLFVRRRAVLLAGRNARRCPELSVCLEAAVHDPSPYVRQALAQAIWFADRERACDLAAQLAGGDASAAVRAAAIEEFRGQVSDPACGARLRAVLLAALAGERDPFVLRVALKSVAECHLALVTAGEEQQAAVWVDAMLPALAHLHADGRPLAARGWAARARERLWSQGDAERRRAHATIRAFTREIPPGGSAPLPAGLAETLAEEDLGRLFAQSAEDDYTVSLSGRAGRTPRVHRGEKFGFRVWRWLHELRHPATEKRQAFCHTLGRIYYGTVRAPAAYMAEQTATRVPGEPVYIEAEDGWRPYLPLVDEAISCIDETVGPATVRWYTAQGVTELTAPATFAARLRARALLTLRFAEFAHLRNWRPGGAPPDGYARALEGLGFRVCFRPYASAGTEGWRADPAVTRFFPAGFAALGPEFFNDLKQYFFSVYENTLYELALFVFAVATLAFGRQAWITQRVRAARRRVPLVIGGWGTRGKSGTERMKAAVFNALGYNVVSKTTGTEAMFLHGHRFGPLAEMFLFRPYDKATIWEQVNVLRLAADLEADVFLWECMGLTPAYVSILAQDWMKDDLATITNTYPDHEDLQGPAGINIPDVMAEFIPAGATLVTSEHHMLPKLREAARRRGTETHAVNWLETGLVPADVLARFPYDEHPANVALVAAMARVLGVEDDFALKAMADQVVPDLGVLKTFPRATVDTRVLEFVNGMSANERLGFMGNWQRIGFARHDADADPGTWITTLINNRADRVPRSRVFADVVVRDIAADRHYLIGTNLQGFTQYLEESWAQYAADYTLWESGPEAPDPVAKFLRDAQARRIAVDAQQARTRVVAMLAGIGAPLDTLPENIATDRAELAARVTQAGHAALAAAVLAHAEALECERATCAAFAAELTAARAADAAIWNRRATAILWEFLHARVVVIHNAHIGGDAIIERIAASTPPGYRNWIMGAQNIKGPGLDFVYRWQAWERCHRACQDASSGETLRTDKGLTALAGFQEFGVLCGAATRQAIAAARRTQTAQTEALQSRLQVIEENLAAQTTAGQEQRVAAGGESVWVALLNGIEAFLDAGDAVRRRKRADQIYRDLVTERISKARAAIELQALNKRQKGGWLARNLQAMFAPRT